MKTIPLKGEDFFVDLPDELGDNDNDVEEGSSEIFVVFSSSPTPAIATAEEEGSKVDDGLLVLL